VEEVIDWSRRHPDVRLRCWDNPARLQAAAFNAGLRRCDGDLVFVMSSTHGDVDPDYLTTMVAALAAAPDVWVAGGHSVAVGRTPWGDAVARAITSPVALGAPAWRRGGGTPRDVDHVGYGLYRREAFDRVGGFAEDLVINEDYEMTWRMRAAGGRVRLCPTAQARYLTRDTPRRLARQYLVYGLHKARMLRRHPRSTRLRHVVPAAAVVAAVALAVATPWSRRARRVAAIGTGAYTALTAAAALRVSADEPTQAPRVAAAMLVMHTCYGVGNVVGVWRSVAPGSTTDAPVGGDDEPVLLWSWAAVDPLAAAAR
jgi:succinoglycan biosynthesis protein ExoA